MYLEVVIELVFSEVAASDAVVASFGVGNDVVVVDDSVVSTSEDISISGFDTRGEPGTPCGTETVRMSWESVDILTFTAAASDVLVDFGELVTGTEVVVAAVGEVATALDKLAHGFDTGNKLIWNRGG